MKLEVIGNVQDGAVPHLSCDCEVCEEAREKEEPMFVNSILLKENDNDSSVRYLFGASPDIRLQIKGDYLDGVFVSDTHLGDITGLLWFGRASANYSGIPVYGTGDIRDFIMKNDPYRLLIDRDNIKLEEVEDGDEVELQGASVEIREVIEHGDYADSLSFMIKGEEKKVYYATDLDKWTQDAVNAVEEADIAIVDGCFWSDDEIERYEEVPHPTVQDTMDQFEDCETEIYLTNMNHTNPILREGSEERKEVEENGFQIVERGMEFEV
jgi:pyrroloquinoline quinone biosynthesis protein B